MFQIKENLKWSSSKDGALIFIFGLMQMYTSLFLTKYVDYVYFPYYTMLVIAVSQALGLSLLSLKDQILKFKPVFNFLYLVGLIIISRSHLNANIFLNIAGLFLVLAFYQIQIIELIENKTDLFKKLYLKEMLGAIAGVLVWLLFTETLGFKGFLMLHLLTFTIWHLLKNENKILKIGLLFLAAGTFILSGEPQPLFNKRDRSNLLSNGQVVDFKWNTNAHVELVETNDQSKRKLILFDGGLLRSTVYEFDGDYAKAREKLLTPYNIGVWSLDVAVPAFMLKDKIDNALLISAVGGQEIFAAKSFGAKKITAVDINGAAQSFSKDYLKDYNGHLYDESVQVYTRDGRKTAEESNEKFDLIQIYSANNAAYLTGMGLGLRLGSLVTVEAIETYLDKLSENGILNLSQTNYPQIKTTLESVALKRNYKNNLLAISPSDMDGFIKSFYFKKTAWKKEEVDELVNWLSRDPLHKWDILINPSTGETPAGQLARGERANEYFQNKAATDDWPFIDLVENPVFLIQTKVFLALFAAAVFLFALVGTTSFEKFKNKSPVYFSFGILFGILQQSSMHLMQKMLGRPDWGLTATLILSLAVSIFALVLADKYRSLKLKAISGILLTALFFNYFKIGSIYLIFLFAVMLIQSFIFVSKIKEDLEHVRWAWWTNGLGFVFGVSGYYLLFAIFGFTSLISLMLGIFLAMFLFLNRPLNKKSP